MCNLGIHPSRDVLPRELVGVRAGVPAAASGGRLVAAGAGVESVKTRFKPTSALSGVLESPTGSPRPPAEVATAGSSGRAPWRS